MIIKLKGNTPTQKEIVSLGFKTNNLEDIHETLREFIRINPRITEVEILVKI